MVAQEKRFCLLLAAKDSEFLKKVYGGYLNVFASTYGEEGEKWDVFRVVEGEFPDANELEKYDGFVISGSPSDAHGNQDWVLKLCSLCTTLDSMKKKVLGICFGHQILCRIKGGKTGRAHQGLDIAVRQVRLVKELASKYSYFGDQTSFPSSLAIIKCHQDEIWEPPVDADVIGYSDWCGVEMFAMEDHILGIQGHPEYDRDIVFDILDRALAANILNNEQVENGKSSMEKGEPDRKSWEMICRNFLKGGREKILATPEDANHGGQT